MKGRQVVVEVIAFVGPSGTGKSHRAIGVAFDNKCDAIIDDGLLIKGTRILAGTSAKNEENRIQAVKRAIFTDDEHARVVREALGKNNIRRLLIIATSDNMINKICKRLNLEGPAKTVYIHQIASKKEIKKARYSRLQEGKHIVPVPSVELKPQQTSPDVLFIIPDSSETVKKLQLSFTIWIQRCLHPAHIAQILLAIFQHFAAQDTFRWKQQIPNSSK